MPVYDCHEDCGFATRDVPDAMATIQMQHHLATAHTPGGMAPTAGPSGGIDEEAWQLFLHKWKMFKGGANVKDGQVGPQLFNCCTDSLQNTIIKGKTDFTDLNEKDCLESIK